MNTIARISLFFFLMLSVSLSAQTEGSEDVSRELKDILKKIKSGESIEKNDAAVEETTNNSSQSSTIDVATQLITSSLYLVRQEYKVVAGGTEEGRDGKPYYGFLLGVGVQVGEVILLPKQLYEPWDYDDEYSKVKLKYPSAVANPVKVMASNEAGFSIGSSSISSQAGYNLSYLSTDNTKALEGVEQDGAGSQVLILLSVNDLESEKPIIYKTTREIGQRMENGRLVLEALNVPKNCVGGVLFQKVLKPGQLTMKVLGIGSMVQSDMVIYGLNSSSTVSEKKPSSSEKSSERSGSRGGRDKDKKEDKKEKVKEDKPSRSSGRRTGRRGDN